MSERRPKPDEVNHQIYIDERKALVEAEQTIAHNFDKNIFTLAAGALGISLVFLEKFTSNPETFGFLYISWFSLVASLSATLSSLLIGQYAFRRARDILENEFFPKEDGTNRNYWASFAEILNWSSIIFFVVGIGALAWFGTQNVKANLINKKSETAIITTVGGSNEQHKVK
jgi:hypothetical protein